MENLYSIDEAARKLGGISRNTVSSWLVKGKLQRTKVGARTMIAESELEKILVPGGASPTPRRHVDSKAKTNASGI